jgi:hypothetical protein
MMRKWIIRALKWALRAAEIADPRVKRAKELVIWADETFKGKSGERKRSQVLSKLAHEFPDVKLKDLAFLIEKAIQEIG